MKGSNRGNMKEVTGSAVKPRISTRSTGQANNSSSRSLRALKSPGSTSSPIMVSPRRLRSLSPGTKDGKLRPKRAKVEKDLDTPRAPKSADSTPKHAALPNPEPSEPSIQSSQTTPKGAGIRTRLSTGSIQMNGTMTISAAKEKAEMDQIIKQIAKSDTGSATKTQPPSLRKRQTMAVPSEPVPADHPPPKRRKIGRNDGSGEDNCNDYFCWLCHKEGTLVCCELCPRVYHTRCLGLSAELPQDWVCPECEKIMRAECVDTRSKAMEMLTIEQLCTLLKYALERMKHAGSEPFQKPVDISAVPNYSDYVFHPMDLTTLEKNIKKKMYGCTEALLADAKWIVHNCIIYNGAHHKLTNSAKMIVKICKHEMNEIELCPDCYLNSCVRKDDEWFSDTCRVPHTLVWAKLKGYPFWPSKALREVDGQVDVRFFGAHDRSWVPVSQCFLLSKNIPTSLQKGKKNNGLDMAIEELNLHVKKLREKFGGFEYAPFRTPYDKSDSYKPIIIQPELLSKPNTVPRLSQRESKIGNSSSFSSNKPNILRNSVAKIRNKYSAIVTLKKMESSPEKGKKTPEVHVDGKSVMKEAVDSVDGSVEVEPDTAGDQTGVTKSDVKVKSCSDKGINKDLELETYLKGPETVESKGKEKGIKKTFVSSSLIQQIEDKLKGIVNEPVEKDEKEGEEMENMTKEKSKTEELSLKPKDPEEKNNKTIEQTNQSEGIVDNSESKLKDEMVENKFGGKSSPVSETEAAKPLENLLEKKNVNDPDDNKHSDNNQKEIEVEKIVVDKVGTSNTDLESKDSYRKKLDTMIKSCKEKLGMDGEKAVDNDSVISENDEEDDENDDSSDEDDDDNEYVAESDDNSDESESEEASEEGKEKSEIHSSRTVTEISDIEKDSKQEKSGSTDKQSSDPPESRETDKDSKLNNTEEGKSELINEDTKHDKSKLNEEHNPGETNKEKKDHHEMKSAITDNATSSVSHGITDNSDATKEKDMSNNVGKEDSKAMNEKILDPQSGEFKDLATRFDDDSDTDRLVIDLEEESNKDQSKTICKKETSTSKKSTSITSPKSDVINIVKELKKVKEGLENKTEENDPVSYDKVNTSEPNANSCNDKDGVQTDDVAIVESSQLGKGRSRERMDKSQAGDIVEKGNSSKLSDKTQSGELKNRRKSKSPVIQSVSPANKEQSESPVNRILSKSPVNRLRSKSPVNRAQSKSPVNRVLSKSPVNRVLSKSPVNRAPSISPVNRAQSSSPLNDGLDDRQQSNECMDIDDDDDDEEVHDDLSSDPLDMYSNMPSNMSSSIPDKNFVKPPQVDDVDDLPSSSNLAEKFSKKLLEKIQQTVDEMCSEVIKEKSDSKTVELLNKKLKQARWNYYAELNELKHNFQLTMYEMKSGWDSEKEQITKSLTAKLQAEKELAVKEAKKKQWCAHCGKEAIFYCCWNTSYCDYPCQQNHWPQHMHTCLQTNKDKTLSTNSSTSANAGQKGQGHIVSQTSASIPVSAGTNVPPQTSVSAVNQPTEPDHLRRLQDNLKMALQREEEKRGDGRPGVSPKFNPPMSSPMMQNIRQPGPAAGGMMFNMQQQMQPGMMQQIQRTRFPNQQQMAMQVQQRSSLPQSQQQQQGNPRMLFSQPLIQQTIYPLQVQPQQQLTQQQLGGTLLFQNPQQNLMTYGMPPRPY